MLQIEAGRQKNMLMADRLCVFCKELDNYVLEDEYHFLMLCPAYTDFRSNYLFYTEYILQQFYRNTNRNWQK